MLNLWTLVKSWVGFRNGLRQEQKLKLPQSNDPGIFNCASSKLEIPACRQAPYQNGETTRGIPLWQCEAGKRRNGKLHGISRLYDQRTPRRRVKIEKTILFKLRQRASFKTEFLAQRSFLKQKDVRLFFVSSRTIYPRP